MPDLCRQNGGIFYFQQGKSQHSKETLYCKNANKKARRHARKSLSLTFSFKRQNQLTIAKSIHFELPLVAAGNYQKVTFTEATAAATVLDNSLVNHRQHKPREIAKATLQK